MNVNGGTMSTNPNPRACALLRSVSEPAARFEGVKALAEHVRDLCKGRPIYLKRGVVSGDGWSREMVAVRFADEDAGDAAIGYAIIGEPALNGAVQFELLGAALVGVMPAQAEAA